MLRLFSALPLLAAFALPAAAAEEVDHGDPVAVLDAVFAAARDGDDSALAGLCDPTGDGDGDTKMICGMKADSDDWGEMEKYFAKGKIDGEASIEGDEAAVPFLFGPDGTRDETMNLIRRDGKWYLSSF